MAIEILTDATIIINGVTLSDHAQSVTVTDTREQKDITAFGASNKAYGKGLGDASITVNFFQDFAAGKIHATLQPLIGASTPITVEVRKSSAARSTTNPAYVISALLFEYGMVAGGVGEPSMIQAPFVNASNTGVQYLTA
jgi:hypothetical protein